MSSLSLTSTTGTLSHAPIENVKVLKEFLLATTDNNILQIVLSYAGDPTIEQMSDLAFKFILGAYNTQGLLSRFFITPSDISRGQHRQVVMDLFDRVLSLSLQPALLPDIQRALRTGAPLALSPIVELAAPALDLDSIKVFGKIAEQIPGAKKLLDSEEFVALPGDAEKAARIRTWLSKNRALFGNVTKLDLSNLTLSTVPLELEFFGNLEILDLSSNRLTAMPDLRLPRLQWLYLGRNYLREVPDFSHLQMLQMLSIANNQLSVVADFSHLPNLLELYLNNNQLSVVANFSYLPRLKELHLNSNNLKEVPRFSHLPCLKELNLSGNQMTEVVDLSHFQYLEWLNLSDNQIKAVPYSHLPLSLQTLELYGDPKTTISGFEQLCARGCQIFGI